MAMSEPVVVVTTIAMKAVLEQIEPELVAQTGRGIAMAFGPPSRAVQMIRDGEPADIVMTTPEGVAELFAAHKVVAATAPVVARMIMGVAVRAEAPKPDISTVEAFKQAILAARSVTYANPALGSPSAAHFLRVADRLGIGENVRAKALVSRDLVARHVAAGEAEMAVQQMSELVMVEGVVPTLFPDELQNIVPLAAAIHRDAASPDAARALIDLLAAPRAHAIIEKAGMLPGG
jgi:molybdate transport system substrate-binding protein